MRRPQLGPGLDNDFIKPSQCIWCRRDSPFLIGLVAGLHDRGLNRDGLVDGGRQLGDRWRRFGRAADSS